jgi:hypothetical protein
MLLTKKINFNEAKLDAGTKHTAQTSLFSAETGVLATTYTSDVTLPSFQTYEL